MFWKLINCVLTIYSLLYLLERFILNKKIVFLTDKIVTDQNKVDLK